MRKRIPAAVLAIVILLALLGAGGAYLNWLAGAPRRALERLSETLRTQHRDEVHFFFKVNQISPKADLVLAEIKTEVTGEYSSYKDLLGIDFGTTTLTFSVPVRYLYAVHVGGEQPVSFRLDAASRTLFLSVSQLRVLSAEADFGKLEKTKKVGWARLERFSGRDVERQFRDRVTQDVRERGNLLSLRAEAETIARKELTGLLRRYLAEAHPAAAELIGTVEISFDLPASPRAIAPD